jgi:pyruvate dehydrogenase E2 component (dihydrolipoamide acetyltransferase)
MSIDITMPALSPTMEEGTLAKWLVKPGDTVKSGQVIAEIETDKATMEVEAVDEGVVLELLVPAGAEGVKVNAVIARLADEDPAGVAAAAPVVAAPGLATPSREPPAQASGPASDVRAAPLPAHVAAIDESPRPFASPLARRIAAAAGVNLAAVAGSGPNGRIVKRDVEAVLARAPQAVGHAASAAGPSGLPATTAVSVPSPARTLEQKGVQPGSYDLVPLDGMRRTIARRMTESFRDTPHFPLTVDLEIDRLLKARADINDRFKDQGVKVSVNDFVIRASALALKMVPASNASYTPDGLALHHHADIAVAVAIDGGLITPIIRQAEYKGLAAISQEMRDLAERARQRRLKPEEYLGGTFSISNLGMMGIRSFASILNEPHGMIMSVGAGEQRPVVRNGALAIATVMTVTLTCDHRVVDGAIGAAFLKAFRGFIEDPMAMLL